MARWAASKGKRPGRGTRHTPQLGLELRPPRTHGGARAGAGRKRGKRVQHAVRPRVPRGCPAHATLRLRGDLPSLRRRETFALVERALAGVLGRPGFSVVHFSVQTNHVHLLVEARDTCALARGMQALAIRLALALNRHLGRKGPVLSDRYHARALRTPREVRNALSYVLNNFRRHVAASWRRDGSVVNPYWLDPCSSARAFDGWRGEAEPPEPGARPPPISPAATWLFTVGWRRHGLVRVDETPPSAWA